MPSTKCGIARCGRDATVVIVFTNGGSYNYCTWHSQTSRGDLRWKSEQIAEVSPL